MILIVLAIVVGLSAIVLMGIVSFLHGYRVGRVTAERDLARAELKELRKR